MVKSLLPQLRSTPAVEVREKAYEVRLHVSTADLTGGESGDVSLQPWPDHVVILGPDGRVRARVPMPVRVRPEGATVMLDDDGIVLVLPKDPRASQRRLEAVRAGQGRKLTA